MEGRTMLMILNPAKAVKKKVEKTAETPEE
jgi:hypothetical protein